MPTPPHVIAGRKRFGESLWNCSRGQLCQRVCDLEAALVLVPGETLGRTRNQLVHELSIAHAELFALRCHNTSLIDANKILKARARFYEKKLKAVAEVPPAGDLNIGAAHNQFAGELQ